MDVLYNNMSLSDQTEWAKSLTNERIGEIWENAEIVLPDYKTWQKNYTETEKNLVMINKVPKEPRALGLTAYGLINQTVMYWNCEEQWKSYDNGVKPTELCFCKLQAVSF